MPDKRTIEEPTPVPVVAGVREPTIREGAVALVFLGGLAVTGLGLSGLLHLLAH